MVDHEKFIQHFKGLAPIGSQEACVSKICKNWLCILYNIFPLEYVVYVVISVSS